MSIITDDKNKIFKLDTDTSSYVFCVSEIGALEHLYYGKRISDVDVRQIARREGLSFAFMHSVETSETSPTLMLSEYASFNAGDHRIDALRIENGDGTIGSRLQYVSYRVYEGREKLCGMPSSRNGSGCQTLAVLLADAEKGIEVELFYTVYPAQDVIARYQIVTNRGKKDAYIQRAASLCVDFYDTDLDVVDLKGVYGYERGVVQRMPLQKGVYTSGSTLGSTTHHTNPFFALVGKNADEDIGEAYGFNLVYSGSFSYEVELEQRMMTRVTCGIQSAGLRWKLSEGESFHTPEAVMTYSDEGIGGVSRHFHDHIRENIVEPNWAYKQRPIVVNTWEGSHFAVTEDYVLALADEALKVGADTVVLDDGWFREGNDTGLGDWRTVKHKFPHGIAWLADAIHAKGLKFGIWIEPEMIAMKSAFLQEKPDKILRTHDKPLFSRNQFLIDLTDDETVDYIFDRITSELDGVHFDYLKWDANRYITEAGSLNSPCGEVYHRQTLGVYKLFEKFKEKYPDVIIENCSGGGGRFDLGMLYYAPQIWASDNTDPYERTYIQYGTSLAYPTSTISCHFTKMAHNGEASSDFRYAVASFGPYGYELDLTTISEKEKAELKAYTEKYRKIADFSLHCDLYRLISPDTNKFCAYMQVTKDKKQALFTFIRFMPFRLYSDLVVKLRGLDENTVYEDVATGQRLTGGAWMRVGLRIPKLTYGKPGYGVQHLLKAVELVKKLE